MTRHRDTSERELSFVVYSADYWEHVCPTVRITGPAEFAGVNIIHGNDWQGSKLVADPKRVDAGDLVIIQRNFPQHTTAYKEVIRQARSRGKIVVYELDDLLPELPDQHPDYYIYLTSRSAIIRAVAEADAVISCTQTLSESLRLFNSNVWTVPNYLNDRLWKLVSPTRREKHHITIGYLGGHSHSYDLETISHVLSKILKKYGDQVILKFWGLPPPAEILEHPNIQWTDVGMVSYAAFATYFVQQQCDLFIAPLADNAFNRAKSWLKYLEYSALGVPGVYSKITPYTTIVKHGDTGYLASTSDEWEARLVELIEDPDLRYRMGSNAQAHVQTEWLLSQNSDTWINTYKEILSNPLPANQVMLDERAFHKLLSWGSDLESKTVNHHQRLIVAEQERAKIEQERAQAEKERAQIEQERAQTEKERAQIEQKSVALSRKLELAREQLLATEEQYAALIEKDKSTRKELAEKEQTAWHFSHMYYEIYNSRSWRLIKYFQRIRLTLIPQGSRQEEIISSSIRGVRLLVREGPGALISAARRRMDGGTVAPGTPSKTISGTQIERVLSIGDGELLDLPAISIIMIQNQQNEAPNVQAVQAWLQNQTLATAANLVIWDVQAGHARYIDSPDNPWSAPEIGTFLQSLQTRYICIASQDLLEQPQTYLELNLIALETGTLVFTINLRGSPDWIAEHIEQGCLPGSENKPLLRLLVRKEYIRDDFRIDLSPWLKLRNGKPGVAGRVVYQTTSVQDESGRLPLSTQIIGGETKLLGPYILVRPNEELGWSTVDLELHSVDTVLPAVPLSHEIPSAIMVHPFLAVGGAEQIHLKVMGKLQDKLRFAVVTFEPLHYELGTMADAYREVTPLVYTLPDFLEESLNWSFINYLIRRLQPHSLYIANGTPWMYDNISELKRHYPNLRTIDQVYDSAIGWINRYDQSIAMYVDAHIGVNSKICQSYIEKGARPEGTYMIENGIEPDEFDPADYSVARIQDLKSKFGLPPDKKIVTFASRIHQQKRPMDFVELARRFKTDDTLACLMVGDGPLAGVVEEQINRMGLDNLYRLPFQRPVSDILAVTDVLVLPSEFEGMPMIIIEAQAMGKPVVVTNVGNNREIISRTQGGVVVSQIGDIAKLVEGVRQMIEQPPDPANLRQNTLAYFDISLVAQKYYDVLIENPDA